MGENNGSALDDLGDPRDYRSDPFHLREAPLSKMSDARLRRHKNVQAGLAVAGSTIGLAALGAKGGGGVARKVIKNPVRAARVSSSLERHTNNALIAGAGVGGVAGFNTAAISRAEAKKPQHIHKDWSDFDRRRKVDPLVRQYGLKKPLPSTLDRKTRGQVWEARDKRLNHKKHQWEHAGAVSNHVKANAETVVGGVTAGAGAASLRNKYKKENPGKLEDYAAKKGKYVKWASKAEPNFKTLAVAAGAGVLAAGARQAGKVAEKKQRKYSSREGGTASAAVQRLNKSAFGVDH